MVSSGIEWFIYQSTGKKGRLCGDEFVLVDRMRFLNYLFGKMKVIFEFQDKVVLTKNFRTE